MQPEEAFALMVSEGDMVLDKLDECVAEHPDKTFIYYGEDEISLSFRTFKDQTDSLAAGLAELGIGPEDRVSVITRNSLTAAYAMFGIWRAGAVFAPINFHYKGRLLSYQIQDTAPKALIVDVNLSEAVEEVLPEISVQNLIVWQAIPGEHDYTGAALGKGYAQQRVYDFRELLKTSGEVPRVKRAYFDTANIIYTSGTTGPSKGVVQSFRWLNQYGFLPRSINNSEDVFYCDLPLYHVGGAFALLVRSLWRGNTVGLWDRFSPSRFWDRIRECGATHCVLMDVMVPWLMSAEPSQTDRNNTLNKVHMQPLPTSARAVARRFGFDFVTSGFGQTETGAGFVAIIDQFGKEYGTPPELYQGLSKQGVRAAARQLNIMVVDGEEEVGKGLMGRPSPLLQACILDHEDNACEPGQVGQLVFRPRFPFLMLQEYFNKPEKTLEAFRNLWFHTGDACYRNADGVFYFVDRMGGFLRVRGENVSSYEVEDLVNTHPKVRVTAAIPVPAREGSEEDVAIFIEAVEDEALDIEEVRAHCMDIMPKYMVPRYVRLIESMPLTPTGKIEKYKLRQRLLEEIDADRAN